MFNADSIPVILIAEDNDIDTLLMEAILKEFYLVEFAINGSDALTMLKTKHYDLLITDITMPVMGGIELLVVTEALYPELPVVVVSSISWQYHAYRDKYPNAKMWIDKPYKPSVLLGLVTGIIANSN